MAGNEMELFPCRCMTSGIAADRASKARLHGHEETSPRRRTIGEKRRGARRQEVAGTVMPGAMTLVASPKGRQPARQGTRGVKTGISQPCAVMALGFRG
jgi:hypothetical protein